MLTFFPKPYPDELLYSIIARYHVWSGNDEISDTMEQLFDNRRERATLLIPKHLQRLAEKTKKYGLNYETLLFEHTIFPFVTCFLNRDSFYTVLTCVNNIDQKESLFYVYRHSLCPRYLRYCSLCVRDDRDNYGEGYWHRKHQTYGVVMCDKHKCYLKESEIEILDNRNNRYIALELLNELDDNSEQKDVSGCRIELQIANDVEYIYRNHEFIRKLMWEKHFEIRETTIDLLFNRDLATKKGLVKIDRLRHEFQVSYSSTQLKQLLTDFNDDKKSDWLIALCRGGQNTVVPIRFILFADFLAGSIESYIKVLSEQKPFIDRKKKVFQPPDGYEAKLVQYRRRWINAWKRNPNGCRFDLVKADRPAYTWLRRHDNEWMLNNSPHTKKPQGTITCKDWVKVDNELEGTIIDAVNYIKKLGGKPERITKTNICRYMKQRYTIEKNYKLLPSTMHKIEQYIESTSEYRLRKIEWAKIELENEGKPAIPWLILRKAGIRDKDWSMFRDLFTS